MRNNSRISSLFCHFHGIQCFGESAYLIDFDQNRITDFILNSFSQNFSIGIDGLKLGGRLYVYCLGNDFGDKACPKDMYIHGIETYDYMWAKRLKPDLKKQLMEHENKLKYYCDSHRHLVCLPYSIENLHKMAESLGIKRCWFHKDHYDIPKRRINEIMERCKVVSTKEIVKIVKM